MKYRLGLFIFLSFSSAFGATTQLILRARVPASYSVSEDDKHRPVVNSNQSQFVEGAPEVKIIKDKKFYTITVVQP